MALLFFFSALAASKPLPRLSFHEFHFNVFLYPKNVILAATRFSISI